MFTSLIMGLSAVSSLVILPYVLMPRKAKHWFNKLGVSSDIGISIAWILAMGSTATGVGAAAIAGLATSGFLFSARKLIGTGPKFRIFRRK